MIVVCGEALVDVVEQPDGTQRATPGGGPFNTARALARLGAPVAFLGHLSQDEHGRRLRRLLAGDGVNLDLATMGPERTTIARAVLDAGGHARYEFETTGTAAPNLTQAPAFGIDVEALYVGSLGLVLEPMATTLLDLVRREHRRCVIVLDPNVRPGLIDDGVYRDRLRSVAAMSTIVKASDSDLEWLEEDAGGLLRAGARLVAVTRGPHGATAFHGTMRVDAPARPVEVADTIGAGDAFGAGLVAWLHDHHLLRRDLSLREPELRAAVEYACLAAALTCARAGAEPPTRAEIEAAGR